MGHWPSGKGKHEGEDAVLARCPKGNYGHRLTQVSRLPQSPLQPWLLTADLVPSPDCDLRGRGPYLFIFIP